MRADQEAEALTARDNIECSDVLVYIHSRDGTGDHQCLSARGTRPPILTWCAEHFVAHGVCVDCTRALGHIVYAS